jgi:hypothetical protein
MHPELIARAISGIMSPHTNVDQFIVNSMIFSKSVARNVIHYLNLNGIDSISGKVRLCGISLISTYAKKQLTRTELLLKTRRKSVMFAIPVILTLHSEKLRFIKSPHYTHQ